MKRYGIMGLMALLLAGACLTAGRAADGLGYARISQEAAREMMARQDGHIVLDVRREDEYAAGHIPGAVLLPNEEIGTERPAALPDLEQIILVYCRSGNRSKQAAGKLAAMGYSHVYEFGGILTWTGEIARREELPVLVIEVNGHTLYAALENNPSARALAEKLSAGPVEIGLRDYGGFEKVGDLPWELPRSDENITTRAGDVILYQGRQITFYYDVNTWDFTRLAVIGEASREGLLAAFGETDATARLWVEYSE